MKYTLLPVYWYSQFPDISSFKCPLICSDYIYNLMPAAGDNDYLLAEGSALGYLSLNNAYVDLKNALKFNPFKCREYYLNSVAVDHPIPTALVDAFNGTWSTNNTQFNGIWCPQEMDENHLIGYGDLSGDSLRGTNGVNLNTSYLGVKSEITGYRELSADDGIIYRFNVMPLAYIEDGKINVEALKKHNGNYRYCICKIYVYYVDTIVEEVTTRRFYWYIKLENYTCSSTESNKLALYYNGMDLGTIYDTDDPNGTTQPNDNEGGNGDNDPDSDPIDVPDLPEVDVTALGGIKLYRVSNTDIAALFDYLSSHAPGDSILKWFSNPIQAIMACYYLPYPVEVSPSSTGITVLGVPTGVGGYKASPWTKWSLGSVKLGYGFEDTFLDYSPFSRLKIYLPFIGVHDLNIDECVGKTIGVTYEFDNTSGACVAFVTVNGTVRYTFSGSCAIGIPIAQTNWGQFYMAAATTAAGAISGGFGGAAAAIGEGKSVSGIAAGAAAGAVQMGGNLADLNAKPSIARSGTISGAGSALGIEYPFLIVERPDKAKVSNPRPVIGVPSGRTLSLGALSGYNIIEHVHLHGIAATGPELEEIERLLYEGVVF